MCEGREAEDRERCLEMEMEQRGKVVERVNATACRFVPGLCTPSQRALCPRLASKGWSSWRDPYRRSRKGSKDLRSRSGHLEDSSKPLEVWAHLRVQPRSLLPPKPIPLCSRMEAVFLGDTQRHGRTHQSALPFPGDRLSESVPP